MDIGPVTRHGNWKNKTKLGALWPMWYPLQWSKFTFSIGQGRQAARREQPHRHMQSDQQVARWHVGCLDLVNLQPPKKSTKVSERVKGRQLPQMVMQCSAPLAVPIRARPQLGLPTAPRPSPHQTQQKGRLKDG
uniref:Uncharacterized protein n=1 Tax=Eutreptiella gymnastica TaxID=73025 RepID=A0A7S4FQL7_9EUGL